MNGTASLTEWLACSGIGCGTGTVLLGLLKYGLDADGDSIPAAAEPADRYPAYQPPPALPARAPVRRPRHAAPPLLAETQPIRVQPHLARHAKKAA